MSSPAVIAELAPTGVLRAAINFDNPILATKNASTGEPGGGTVALSRELAGRLSVPLEIVPYFAAGKVVASVKSGAWDVCHLAVDPVRAAESPPQTR